MKPVPPEPAPPTPHDLIEVVSTALFRSLGLGIGDLAKATTAVVDALAAAPPTGRPHDVSATELKQRLGEYLLDVRRERKSFHVVDHRYRPPRTIAKLGPLPSDGDVVIYPDGTVHGELLDTRRLRAAKGEP